MRVKKELDEVYKVVGPNRESLIFLTHIEFNEEINVCYKLLIYPQLKNYLRYYPDGEIVWAYQKSAGLFCFSDLAYAKKFTLEYSTQKLKILKVLGIQKVKVPYKLSYIGFNVENILTSVEGTLIPPLGTVLYRGVHVLSTIDWR
jgi:hypothetical protein